MRSVRARPGLAHPSDRHDHDIWIERSPENAARAWQAMEAFGAPTVALGVQPADLVTPDVVIQIGLAPRRIDVLTGVSGLEFDEAWNDRVVRHVDRLDVPLLGRDALVRNKRASGRLKDLGDLEALGEGPEA